MEVYVDDMLVKSKMTEDHTEHLFMFQHSMEVPDEVQPPKMCLWGWVRSGKFLGFMVNQHGIEVNPKKIKVLLEMSSPKKPKEVISLASRVTALSRFVSGATDRCAPFFNVLNGSKRFKWTDKCEQAFQALKEHLGRPPLLSKPI